MSVVVKGMKMPKSCSECRFFNDAWCLAFGTEDWRNAYNKPNDGERLHNCLLVELPKHGRLIDADALLKDFEEEFGYEETQRVNDYWVGEAPTVLESDE